MKRHFRRPYGRRFLLGLKIRFHERMCGMMRERALVAYDGYVGIIRGYGA